VRTCTDRGPLCYLPARTIGSPIGTGSALEWREALLIQYHKGPTAQCKNSPGHPRSNTGKFNNSLALLGPFWRGFGFPRPENTKGHSSFNGQLPRPPLGPKINTTARSPLPLLYQISWRSLYRHICAISRQGRAWGVALGTYRGMGHRAPTPEAHWGRSPFKNGR
jgi:hypothetical protein